MSFIKQESSKSRSSISSISSTTSTLGSGSVSGSTVASSTDLASFFECPVCFEYVLPPILQCPSGHLVCSNCRPKLTCCPTCRGPLGNIRNLAMEKVASTVLFPCKFSTSGCQVTMLHTDKGDHEEACEYRPYSCPCPGASCKWQGALEQVMPHLLNQHRSITTLQGEDIVFLATDIALPGAVDWVMMQSCFGHHFMLVLEKQEKYDGLQQFFAIVQLIGTRKQADNFAYRLELSGHRRRLTWEATPRSIHEGVSSAILNSDCLVFDTSIAQLFAENGNLVDCDAQLKIEMATRMFLILWLLCVGFVVAEDVDFGDPNTCVLDSNKICEKNLQIDCQGELSGFIISPNFPANMLEEHSGKYRLTISSCENSQISLILTDEDFFLGPSNNKFSVGNGLVVGSNTIPPELRSLGDGGNELPDGASTYPFESSSNTMWMEADMNGYRSKFKIQYIVTLLISNIHNYNEKSGNMTSPGYGTSYPIEATEDVHVIDVTAVAGEYVDLLLTVNVLDIKGIYGDYIKIGPGSDPEVQKSAVVLSWRVNKGVQFLIDGPKAHLVFNVVKPVDAEQPSANGFFISYQAIEKKLTTTAPSTSPMPTSPTPLPFDPDILLTDIVYHKYVGAKASSQLAEILQKYAESSGMLEKGQIAPGLTENGTVQIVQVENCYHGWNVDRDTCGLTQSIVRAFYQETGQDNVYVYAFPTEEVKKAVREYGSIHDIVLPEDLVNLYWISVGVILILIILILLGLLIAWRQKMRRDASKRRKYHEIKSNKLSSSVESDISIKGVGNSNHFDMNSGVDNPNFIIDEPEYGRPVMVYDPEKGTFYSRGNQKSTYQAKDLDVGPIRSAAVLNVSPITTNFQRHNGNKRDQMVNDGKDMSSIMPPLSAVPKRGILKQNSNSPTAREFPNIASIPMEEIEDVIFDNHTLKDMQQRRYSPASSSSDTIVSSSKSSRNNSISTDQPIGSHVLYGVTLEGFESDEENETNF